MPHSAEAKRAVRSSYVVQRLSLAESARAQGVPPRTARTWKREAAAAGDDWDRARTAASMAAGGLGSMTDRVLSDFSTMFTNTMVRLQTHDGDPVETSRAIAGLADAYTKVVKAAGCVDPKLGRLSIAMETLKMFGAHVAERDPDTASALATLLESFGEDLASQWG